MTRPTGPWHPSRRLFTLSRMWPIRSNCPHDLFFIEKVHDAVGLHLNPPEHAVVLRADEKPQVPGYPG
jgi:putative transposase